METDRLTLRNVTSDDFDSLVRLYTCPVVREHLGGPLENDSAKVRASFLIDEKPELYWVLTDKNREFIGVIELDKHHDSKDVEVSFMLVSEAWGKDFAQEALVAVVKYSFKVLKLSRIVAETQATNIRSLNLLRKLCFKNHRKFERFGEEQIIFVLYA